MPDKRPTVSFAPSRPFAALPPRPTGASITAQQQWDLQNLFNVIAGGEWGDVPDPGPDPNLDPNLDPRPDPSLDPDHPHQETPNYD